MESLTPKRTVGEFAVIVDMSEDREGTTGEIEVKVKDTDPASYSLKITQQMRRMPSDSLWFETDRETLVALRHAIDRVLGSG